MHVCVVMVMGAARTACTACKAHSSPYGWLSCTQVKQKAAERDWTREQQALGKAQKAALGCVVHAADLRSVQQHKTSGCVVGPAACGCRLERLADEHRSAHTFCHGGRSCYRAAERVGSAATAGGNWVWNASSKATNALKGDAITVGDSALTDRSHLTCPQRSDTWHFEWDRPACDRVFAGGKGVGLQSTAPCLAGADCGIDSHAGCGCRWRCQRSPLLHVAYNPCGIQ
jgi:hypothetical protein